MSAHAPERRVYFFVYAALLVLLAATVAVAQVNLGGLNFVAWVAIAGVKAMLVVLYFMHVRYSSPITRLFAAAGLLWFFTLMALVLSDYLSRSWAM